MSQFESNAQKARLTDAMNRHNRRLLGLTPSQLARGSPVAQLGGSPVPGAYDPNQWPPQGYDPKNPKIGIQTISVKTFRELFASAPLPCLYDVREVLNSVIEEAESYHKSKR